MGKEKEIWNPNATGTVNKSGQKKGSDMLLWPQYVSALSACLTAANLGTLTTMSSQLITDLQRENGSMRMTFEETSWIPTLYGVGFIFGSPSGGVISQVIGRRAIMFHCGLPMLALLLLGGWTNSKAVLLSVRTLQGALVGFSYSNVGVFISETVHPKVRRSLGALQAVFLGLGILYAFVLGYFFSWRHTSYLSGVISALIVITMWILPETPYWLVEKDRITEAKKSLEFYRGSEYDHTKELNEIESQKREKMHEHTSSSACTILSRICSPTFFTPFTCIGVLYGLCQFNGIIALLVYCVSLFEDSGTKVDPKLATMSVGISSTISGVVAGILLQRIKKKTIFLTATLMIALGHVMIGLPSHLRSSYPDLTELASQDLLSALPMVGATLVSFGHGGGIMPALHILLGEVFPTDIRSTSVGIVQTCYSTLHTVSAKLYPIFLYTFTFHGTFYFYAIVNVAMFLWGIITIENVDGMSLVEVEKKYESKRLKSSKSAAPPTLKEEIIDQI